MEPPAIVFRCKFNWFKNNGDLKTHPKAKERFRKIPIIIYGEGKEKLPRIHWLRRSLLHSVGFSLP